MESLLDFNNKDNCTLFDNETAPARPYKEKKGIFFKRDFLDTQLFSTKGYICFLISCLWGIFDSSTTIFAFGLMLQPPCVKGQLYIEETSLCYDTRVGTSS